MSRKIYFEGVRDGIPIGLGYFAVAFSLGIVAKEVGVSAIQGFLGSVLVHASAGENAMYILIGSAASIVGVIITSLIVNARYLLMSCALSQRFDSNTSMAHRFFVGFGITDEIFGATIARDGFVKPEYTYGLMTASIPFWGLGTALGITMGNILPFRIVSALSVALYGMFIAIIIPPSKKDKVVAGLVVISFVASYMFSRISVFDDISASTKTIILTVVIASIGAILFPVKEVENDA